MANDIDGPSNNHIHFSIVKGNQGGHFTIDAVGGEVKVVRELDRETVTSNILSHYSKLGSLYYMSQNDLQSSHSLNQERISNKLHIV